MGTIEYLDALRVRLGVSSDYALAKRLGVSAQRISNYRTKTHCFDADIALKVADLLGRDRAEVYLDIEAERATKAHNGAVLSVISELRQKIAA